jgi:hypothetical protein
MTTGTKALTTPKQIAPQVLASISVSKGIGASSSRSKDRLRFSWVTVTDSREVVPKRTETPATPGRSPRTPSRPDPVRMKNMPAQTRGNSSPQLMLGGLR